MLRVTWGQAESFAGPRLAAQGRPATLCVTSTDLAGVRVAKRPTKRTQIVLEPHLCVRLLEVLDEAKLLIARLSRPRQSDPAFAAPVLGAAPGPVDPVETAARSRPARSHRK